LEPNPDAMTMAIVQNIVMSGIKRIFCTKTSTSVKRNIDYYDSILSGLSRAGLHCQKYAAIPTLRIRRPMSVQRESTKQVSLTQKNKYVVSVHGLV
jgi:hypothetical protein